MSLINIKNLSYCYSGTHEYVFNNVSLQLDSSYRLGLVGRNGRGKTTLLRLISGELNSNGAISHSVTPLYFPFSVDETLTPLAILEQRSGEEWQLRRECNLLELDEGCLYRPLETLSGGEQTKVMLALLFTSDGFMLIDEPTTHLDEHGREVLARYLSGKRGFILVSHDRTLLDGCITHVLAINKNSIQLERGNFSSWFANKAQQNQFEMEQNQRISSEISRLSSVASRTQGWSGKAHRESRNHEAPKEFYRNKAEKLDKSAKATIKRAERAMQSMEGLLKDVEREDEITMSPLQHHASCLLKVVGAGKNGDVNFEVMRNSRVRLVGANGCGKTTLLNQILARQNDDANGNVSISMPSGLVISYLPQHAQLNGTLQQFCQGVNPTALYTLLNKLNVTPSSVANLAQLSQGQKKKLLLAKSICTPAHLYLWDEPLNYVDILTRLQIQSAILNSNATILYIEHDTAFSTPLHPTTIHL